MEKTTSLLQRRPSLSREIVRDAESPNRDDPGIMLQKIPVLDLLQRVQDLVSEAFTAALDPAELQPHPSPQCRRRMRAILQTLFDSTYGGDRDALDNEYLRAFDRESRKALVFACLRSRIAFMRKVGGDAANADLYKIRAEACTLLAGQIIHNGGWTMDELQTQVLTFRFQPITPSAKAKISHNQGSVGASKTLLQRVFPLIGSGKKHEKSQNDEDEDDEFEGYGEMESDIGENALECAIRGDARAFFSHPAVADCIRAIWNGRLQVHKDAVVTRGHFPEFSKRRFPHPSFVLSRCVLPKYQYLAIVLFRLLNLIVYSVVIFRLAAPQKLRGSDGKLSETRTEVPRVEGWEGSLYMLSASFLLYDLRTAINAGWTAIRSKLWFWVDIITQTVFTIAFIFRMLSFMPNSRFDLREVAGDATFSKEMHVYTLSLNLLCMGAPLMWLQFFNFLDLTQRLGPMIVMLRTVLARFVMFLPFAAFAMLGMAQGLTGITIISGKYERHPLQPWEIAVTFGQLLKGFFGQPIYDAAREVDPVFAQSMATGHQIIATLMVAVLSAILIEAFQGILAKKDEEYFYYFANRILDYFKAPARPADALAIPPLTLFTFALWPLHIVAPRLSSKLDELLVIVLFTPIGAALALYEWIAAADPARDIAHTGIQRDSGTSYAAGSKAKHKTKSHRRIAREIEAQREQASAEIQVVLHSDLEQLHNTHINSSNVLDDSDTEKLTVSNFSGTDRKNNANAKPSEVAGTAFRNEAPITTDKRAQLNDKDKNEDASSKGDEKHKNDEEESAQLPLTASPSEPWTSAFAESDEDARWKILLEHIAVLNAKIDQLSKPIIV